MWNCLTKNIDLSQENAIEVDGYAIILSIESENW